MKKALAPTGNKVAPFKWSCSFVCSTMLWVASFSGDSATDAEPPRGYGRSRIWNLFMVPAKVYLLCKGRCGVLNILQLKPADRTSSFTSIQGTAHIEVGRPYVVGQRLVVTWRQIDKQVVVRE